MLEELEYVFEIPAQDSVFCSCRLEEPFELYGYTIERENVQTFAIHFDSKHQKQLNSSRMQMILNEPTKLHRKFAFVANGEKLVMGERIKVKLLGKTL